VKTNSVGGTTAPQPPWSFVPGNAAHRDATGRGPRLIHLQDRRKGARLLRHAGASFGHGATVDSHLAVHEDAVEAVRVLVWAREGRPVVNHDVHDGPAQLRAAGRLRGVPRRDSLSAFGRGPGGKEDSQNTATVW
jgi:hypothetical protein